MVLLLREIVPYSNLLLVTLLPFWAIRRFRLVGYVFSVLFIFSIEFIFAHVNWALTGESSAFFRLSWQVIGLPIALVWASAIYGLVLLANRLKAPPAFAMRLNAWECGGLALAVVYLAGLYSLVPLREEQIRSRELRMNCTLICDAQPIAYKVGTRPFLRRMRYHDTKDPSTAHSTPSAPLLIIGEITNSSGETSFRQVIAVIELTDNRGKRVQLIAVRQPSLSPLHRWDIEIPVTNQQALQLAKKHRLHFGLLYVAAE